MGVSASRLRGCYYNYNYNNYNNNNEFSRSHCNSKHVHRPKPTADSIWIRNATAIDRFGVGGRDHHILLGQTAVVETITSYSDTPPFLTQTGTGGQTANSIATSVTEHEDTFNTMIDVVSDSEPESSASHITAFGGSVMVAAFTLISVLKTLD